MKEAFKTIGVGVIILFLCFCLVEIVDPSWKTEEDMKGQTMTIQYSYVNIREEPSTSDPIIGRKHWGEKVTLTGSTYTRRFSLTDEHRVWYEIILGDESYGWIVAEAIGK